MTKGRTHTTPDALTRHDLIVTHEALHLLREVVASLPERADGNLNAGDLYHALTDACADIWDRPEMKVKP